MMEKKEKFIQIGVTALRGPDGGFLQTVPLYIKAEDGAEEAEERLIQDIGHLFALRMKAYVDGCKGAGVPV